MTISFNFGVSADRLGAAAVLKGARKRARLSQAELARRAGVTQSVISAYESGHRQPSVPVLAALVEAAGYELEMSMREPRGKLGKMTGPVGRRVRQHRAELVAAAAARGVVNLRVFGCVTRGEDRQDSDVDLLADVPEGMGLLGLGRVAQELEAIVGARVDLVPAGQLKPSVQHRAEPDLVTL